MKLGWCGWPDDQLVIFFWGGEPFFLSFIPLYLIAPEEHAILISSALFCLWALLWKFHPSVKSVESALEARCYQSWLTVGIQLLSAIDMCHLLPNLNYVPMGCMDWLWQCTTGFHSIDRKDGLLSIGLQCRLFIISISAQVNMNIMKI